MRLDEENINASEHRIIDDITARLKTRILEENPSGILRRDTHAKMYGLVQAEFSIKANLPPKLAIGLFKEAHTFNAWIRFSNQDTSDKPDASRDIRGMAIKLFNVSGKKLIDDDKPQTNCTTHDFVLISAPMFIAKNPQEFDGMLRAIMGNFFQKLWFFGTHWHLSWNLFRSLIKIANPLHIRYFSATPYRFGEHVVKYAVIPQIVNPDTLPDNPPHNFLRKAMQQQLQYEAVYLDFCVQFQRDDASMPIEDPRIEWNENQAPFQKVATIKILQQDFDNPEHDKIGEELSFNPWRALPEHRPLGSINLARLAIYQTIAEFRRSHNHMPQEEPKNWEIPTQIQNQDQN